MEQRMTHVHLAWVNTRDQQDSGETLVALPMEIGRTASNQLRLSDRHAGVSRQHARLYFDVGNIVLEDLDSLNGVYIGQEKVQRTIVSSGTKVSLGSYLLTICTPLRCTNEDCQRPLAPDVTMCQWCGQFSADAQTRNF